MKRPWLSVHWIWHKNVPMLLLEVARHTQILVFPKQLARVRKQRERKVSDTGQQRVHLVLTTAARISLHFAPLSQQNMESPVAPESQTGLQGQCQGSPSCWTEYVPVVIQFETSNLCVSRVESPEWSQSITALFMLLHCRSGLLKLHPMSPGQEAVDSSCILFVPYSQSGSCLRPQNHNTSLLEICNSDQQGNAACLRPLKHEVGWMPPTELISSTFSTQNLPTDFSRNCRYV